jgi:predicted TIM-barrel fold metal-dependent hydrolase
LRDVEEALAQAEELVGRWDARLASILPPDQPIFDAHVHLGNDIDGMVGSYEELAVLNARYGVERSFMFCLDEPDRHPAFRAANDRTLAFAERSDSRLVPFVRLDLTERPIEEATRCLDAGARGIKLHPRAQRFALNDERLAPVFALAADRRVPILIHGGRGLPPIADHLARLHEEYPDAPLIIAHAGIADMAGLASRLSGKRGVFFDTSVWSPVDLLDFFRQVPPEQIVYASDYPYGQQPASLLLTVKTAHAAGLDAAQLRAILWENAARIADGGPFPEPGPPSGTDVFSQSMTLARVHQYLSMATPLLWTRQADTIGVLGLALNACSEPDGHPAEQEQIRELLLCARDLWRALPELDDPAEQRIVSRQTFRLIHIADILAVTTGA